MPAFDVRIYAESDKIKYNVTVNQTDDGFAFVNDSKGIQGEVLSACVGDVLNMSSTPVPGKKFREWEIEASGRKITTKDNSYTMPACDITVTPVFDIPYSLKLEKTAGGRVSCDVSYAFAGDTVKLNISPEPGYEFDGWEEKPSSLEIAEDGTFTMPKNSVYLKARFVKLENAHSIMSLTDGNGVLLIAKESVKNEKVAFITLPLSGYRLKKVSVRNNSGGSVMVTGNSFFMPDSDVSVAAEFEKVPHTVKLIVSGEEYGTAELITPDVTGIGDVVTFTAEAGDDCKIDHMEVSPWADISAGTGNIFSFEMPDTDSDIIIEFAPITGTETYPWLIGRTTPAKVTASDGHTPEVGEHITGLYIKGDGTEEMMNFSDGSAPWADLFGDEIGKVVFEDVVNISDYALAGNYKLYEVHICEEVKSIGKGAFKGCKIRNTDMIVFEGKPEYIEPDAFEGVEAKVSVSRSWLYGGLTIDDLNNPGGPYQYGGRLTYEVRSGNAELRLALTTHPEDGETHGSVTILAERTDNPNIYRADQGETVYANFTAEEGYFPTVAAKVYKEGIGENVLMNPDKSLTLPTGDFEYVELEVEFKPFTYEVTYDFCGRGIDQKKSWSYNETIEGPDTVPTVTGYEIEGWYTDTGFTKKWNYSSDKMPARDLTLYARWVPKVYEITWKNYNGSELKKTGVAYDMLPSYDGTVPEKGGAPSGKKYVFSGWDPTPAKVTGIAAYTAAFDEVDDTQKTVIFDMNGHGDSSTAPPVQILSGDMHITEPTAPSDSDFIFGGWFKDRACSEGSQWNFATEIVSSDVTTLYAKWTIKTYNVTWKNYDGTVLLKQTAVPMCSYAAYTGDIPKKASTAEKEYAFSKWNPTPGLVNENAEFTAEYSETPRSYIVSFDNGGKGKTPKAQSIKVGDKITDPGDLSVTGYVFGGWYSNASCTASDKWNFDTDTMPSKAITLYAKWTPTKFKMVWKDHDGTVLRVTAADYNTMPVYDGEEPYRAPDGAYEYKFAGWTPGLKRADREENYTAIYDELERQYTVTFDINGKGSGGYSYKTVPGGVIVKPDDPKADGYDFAGWYKDPGCSDEKEFDFDKETMPHRNMTLFAKWTVKEFRIFWKNYNGTVLSETAVDYNTMPVYDGDEPYRTPDSAFEYKFAGWTPELKPADKEETYTAKYDPIEREYTVTWQYDDGSLIDRTSMKYGETPSHNAPSKEGFVFTGWNPTPVPVTADTTYKASFEKKTEDTVTVSFNTDGGSAIAPKVIFKGERVSRPSDPVKSGYTFSGWYKEKSYTTRYDFSKPVEKDIVLYAKFEIKKKPVPPKPDPDPKGKGSSSRGSFFTGTWGHAVSDGFWRMDAKGTWYYSTTRQFCNTWGYIVNPYAKEGQHKADWFWFDDKGRMLTGWQLINGKWYYLNPYMNGTGTLGACLIGPGKTPDGYEIDANGAWTGRYYM